MIASDQSNNIQISDQSGTSLRARQIIAFYKSYISDPINVMRISHSDQYRYSMGKVLDHYKSGSLIRVVHDSDHVRPVPSTNHTDQIRSTL